LTPARQFFLTLTLLLGVCIVTVSPQLDGDVDEYAAMTIAFAEHDTPDIRISDLEKARALLPQFSHAFNATIQGIQTHLEIPKAGFFRGNDGRYYAIHFFVYSALAAIPFKLLESVGLPPFKCYQIVNMAFVLVLGLVLFRMFSSNARALVGLGLFMLCGGMFYWNWSSPECMSAAMLLAGMILFTSGAPMRAGILLGLAAMQNPTIIISVAFAPLLSLITHYQVGIGWRENIVHALEPRILAAIGAGGTLFAMPLLFNFYQFGVPSIIAKIATDPNFMSVARLHAFFFDLNQGMVVSIPGVLLGIVVWGRHSQLVSQDRQNGFMIATVAAMTFVMALPALSVHNWNSVAAGSMRYAFWGAMPLLFGMLWHLRQNAHWPLTLVLTVTLLQGAAMGSALRYSYLEFSPLAQWVLNYTPEFYNPEPEIFAERLRHNEEHLDISNVYTYMANGVPTKTMYHSENVNVDTQLCGAGRALSTDTKTTEADQWWRYLSSPLSCVKAEGIKAVSFTVEDFQKSTNVKLGNGWSKPEQHGGEWNGAWSDGKRSRLTIALEPGQSPKSLTLLGRYFDDNRRTRVLINGQDLGWQSLNRFPRLRLADEHSTYLTIDMEHEAPESPGPQDRRNLAVFLERITLR
jgi:hypothetical protein